MNEKYNIIKNENKDCIILIKSGIFYITFTNDAKILQDIFNFKVIKNKLGFPEKSLGKVVVKLESLGINYVIYDSKLNVFREYKSENNLYINYLDIIDKKLFNEKLNDILIDRIKYLINKDKNNYEKIRDFIDEL